MTFLSILAAFLLSWFTQVGLLTTLPLSYITLFDEQSSGQCFILFYFWNFMHSAVLGRGNNHFIVGEKISRWGKGLLNLCITTALNKLPRAFVILKSNHYTWGPLRSPMHFIFKDPCIHYMEILHAYTQKDAHIDCFSVVSPSLYNVCAHMQIGLRRVL